MELLRGMVYRIRNASLPFQRVVKKRMKAFAFIPETHRTQNRNIVGLAGDFSKSKNLSPSGVDLGRRPLESMENRPIAPTTMLLEVTQCAVLHALCHFSLGG